MKTYQDTETGKLHAFDDGVDPFKLNNRNIPTTLSEIVLSKPSESHVWLNGDWVTGAQVPIDYRPPISSVPAYNPAWIAFLMPYALVLPDEEEWVQISLDQVNSNYYGGNKLSKITAILNFANICALVSYDGGIGIPRNENCRTLDAAIDEVNRIFCAVLLGGLHAEVVGPAELLCGSLEDQKELSVVNVGIHNRLRHGWGSIQERIEHLMYPRILRASQLRNAYLHGIKVICAINNFSPFFLLHGYTAMVYQNRSDALSSLWIVVEQLTSFIWEKKILNDANIDFKNIKKIRKLLNKDYRTENISVRHDILRDTQIVSVECFEGLSFVRYKRNDLVHDGAIPAFEVVKQLWECLFELFECASEVPSIEMRRLVSIKTPELDLPGKINFDEWNALAKTLNHGK